jgi:hypothetical protein
MPCANSNQILQSFQRRESDLLWFWYAMAGLYAVAAPMFGFMAGYENAKKFCGGLLDRSRE